MNLDNSPKGPQIETPKLIKEVPKGEISEKGNSTLSRKLKNKRESQLKKSHVKSIVKSKKSSMIVSNIPNESAVPEPQPDQKVTSPSQVSESPYYENNKKNVRGSKLSKLENKSIHSKKSGLGSKLKKRRS